MELRLQPVREALDLPNVDRAMTEGAAMSLDEVMEYALSRSPDMPIAVIAPEVRRRRPRMGQATRPAERRLAHTGSSSIGTG